jgi:hypothetical protein
VREQRVVLEDGVDVALVRRDAGDRLPASRISPSVGCSKPAIIRSVVVLPQPGRPEQRVELAACDPQIHVVDGRDVAEPLRDADDLDIGRGRR